MSSGDQEIRGEVVGQRSSSRGKGSFLFVSRGQVVNDVGLLKCAEVRLVKEMGRNG